jgi:hypothetical protein
MADAADASAAVAAASLNSRALGSSLARSLLACPLGYNVPMTCLSSLHNKFQQKKLTPSFFPSLAPTVVITYGQLLPVDNDAGRSSRGSFFSRIPIGTY